MIRCLAGSVAATSEDFGAEYLVHLLAFDCGEVQIDGPCLVVDPGQLTAYNPFEQVILTRASIELHLTEATEPVFETRCVVVEFDVPDSLWKQVQSHLDAIVEHNGWQLRHGA